MQKQKPILSYACKDTDFIDGYPPTLFNGVTIRNDSICEVMNTVTKQIYQMYKMVDGSWYSYVIGESATFESLNIQWTGFPESPVLTTEYPSQVIVKGGDNICLLYTSPSPRDGLLSRMPSSA